MINLNNEKNKSAVILNPERSEWVSRSHITGAESVVNYGAKTKRYSAKRDLYGPSLRSTLKMTALAFIFTLATTSESSAGTWDCGEIANTVSCSLDENGVFTISGTGKMKDYYYGNSPWGSTANIQTVVVGKGITSIGNGAFYQATGLTSITIPDSVTSIGNQAFSYARSLTSITLPEGVTSIGNSAFACTGLTSITIPEGVTRIGVEAFYDADSLTSITIPNSVTSIGEGAFRAASSLTSITIPEGVTSIGDSAFEFATGLTSITIPDSVTSIGYHAFFGARSLTSITIPDNINTENWSSYAFEGLPADTKIVCQGGLNTCYEKLAKYFSADDPRCPANVTCNCSGSKCIDSSRISQATDSSQDSSNQDKETISGDFNPADCYNNGQVPYNNQCLDEYPFAKKRWTPAEANEWLHDGNDNFVVITFKK